MVRAPILAAVSLVACLGAAAPVWAGDYVVSVKTPSGDPVADAVVTLKPAAGTPAPKVEGVYKMAQHNIAFEPTVLIAPVGAEVAFPNLDTVRHHVYSFSAAHPFELKLYGHDETRKVKFDRAGIVALGCNIHDQMAGFIDVVDTPYYAKTDAHGEARVSGLPAGPAAVTLWQPYMKTPQNRMDLKTIIPASGAATAQVSADVRRPAMHH